MAEWERWNRENQQKKTLDLYTARANYASAPNNYGVLDAASKYTADKHFMSKFDKPVNTYSFRPTPYQEMLKREAEATKQALAAQRQVEAAAKEYQKAAAAVSGQAKGGGRKRRYRRGRTFRRSRTSRRGRTSRHSRSRR
jgi:hypothetical protein